MPERLRPDTDQHEKHLILLAQQGDQEALSQLYELILPKLIRYFVGRTQDHDASQDLAHTTFLNFMTSIPRYELTNAPVQAYYYTAARHALINHNTRPSQEGMPTVPIENFHLPSPDPNPEEQVIANQELEQLTRAIHRLPPRQRQAIILHFFYDVPYAEIGAPWQLNQNAAKSIGHRALENLRQALNEYASP